MRDTLLAAYKDSDTSIIFHRFCFRRYSNSKLPGKEADLRRIHMPAPPLVSVQTYDICCDNVPQGGSPTAHGWWNWERTDREKLYTTLNRHLPTTTGLETERDIDSATKGIVSAILTAVQESTPKSRISPRSTPGWTRECKEAQQLARRLRRQYQRRRTPEAWEAYRRAKNLKARLTRRTLRDYHRARIKEATNSPDGIWKLAKWARNREPRTTFVPPVQRPDGQTETDTTKKLVLFREAFFPPPPEVDLEDTRTTDTQARCAFHRSHLTKSPCR